MTINFNLTRSEAGCQPQNQCLDSFGCPNNRCPDFTIRRHDTKPYLKVSIADCDGPMDFRGLVIEANMWALAKLKRDVGADDTYFRLADDIGFEQMLVGDIIIMDRARLPEQMLVTGFDEDNKLIQVQRGYHGTTPSNWKKGNVLRIFRVLSTPAEAELLFGEDDDGLLPDGTHERGNELTDSFLVYEWQPEDTCLPGCYWFEFKVLKMLAVTWFLPGGYWSGSVNVDVSGMYHTGTVQTDGSVSLSYDQILNQYVIPNNHWTGPVNQWTDGNYWTGTIHTDGSVVLNRVGGTSPENLLFDPDGGFFRAIWFLQQGIWQGPINIGPDGNYYTGSSYTTSSVKLTFNEAMGVYLVADTTWSGDFHRFDEGIWFTGGGHDDGCVILEKTFIPYDGGFTSDDGFTLTNNCISGLSDISFTPSFVDEGLTPADFGCTLGVGVEWVRRFPITGEGFLIRIAGSPTSEL